MPYSVGRSLANAFMVLRRVVLPIVLPLRVSRKPTAGRASFTTLLDNGKLKLCGLLAKLIPPDHDSSSGS